MIDISWEEVNELVKTARLTERARITKIVEEQKWNDHYFDDKMTTETCDCYDCEDLRQLVADINRDSLNM